MPHGTPDWGLVGPKTTTYGLDDLGEAVARLGSPHVWDRRGDVILMDTFEHGLGQAGIQLFGTGAAVALEGGHAYHGAFCAKLTTGSDGKRWAVLYYSRGLPVSSRLGFEFTFTIPATLPLPEPTTAYWYWDMYARGPAGNQRGTVRYDVRAWTLEYYNDADDWTEFATGVNNDIGTRAWHTGKLVIDYVNLRYVRFILNNLEWDLTGIPFRQWGAAANPYINFTPYLEGQDDENQVAYLDSIIMTQNEP